MKTKIYKTYTEDVWKWVLRKISGPKREEVKGNYRKLYHELFIYWRTLLHGITLFVMCLKPQPHFNGKCPLSEIRVYWKEMAHLVLALFLSSAHLHFHLSRMLAHPIRHWAIMTAHFIEVDTSMVFHTLQWASYDNWCLSMKSSTLIFTHNHTEILKISFPSKLSQHYKPC